MNALLAMTDEIRLYSKQPKAPIDVIAPQHVELHNDLERWGQWSRGGGYAPGTCSSIEGEYDESGGREVRRPTISLPPNPLMMQITRAVLSIPMQHGETIKLFYVKRKDLFIICRTVNIRWADYGTWMFDCRAMVMNRLRLVGQRYP